MELEGIVTALEMDEGLKVNRVQVRLIKGDKECDVITGTIFLSFREIPPFSLKDKVTVTVTKQE